MFTSRFKIGYIRILVAIKETATFRGNPAAGIIKAAIISVADNDRKLSSADLVNFEIPSHGNNIYFSLHC